MAQTGRAGCMLRRDCLWALRVDGVGNLERASLD